ncbi:MAG: DUF4912 domain-containing protein [Thermoguttaceae bacterium]|nr:DUF4912 domain-containing protein [Thermoguttaceae bacterium]
MSNGRTLDSLTFKELCALAGRLELKGWTRLRKAGLVDLLRESIGAGSSSPSPSSSSSDAPKSSSSSSRAPSSQTSPQPVEDPSSPPKRKRGRPRKTPSIPVPEPVVAPPEPKVEPPKAESEAAAVKPKSKRGRKPKRVDPAPEPSLLDYAAPEEPAEPKIEPKAESKKASSKSEPAKTEPEPAPAKPKSKRGRKPKRVDPAPEPIPASEPEPAPVDEKPASKEAEPEAAPVKPKRGRGKKAVAKVESAQVVKEPEVAAAPEPVVEEPPKKRRVGRPRKSEQLAAKQGAPEPVAVEKSEEPVQAEPVAPTKKRVEPTPVSESAPAVAPKRRGRPRKKPLVEEPLEPLESPKQLEDEIDEPSCVEDVPKGADFDEDFNVWNVDDESPKSRVDEDEDDAEDDDFDDDFDEDSDSDPEPAPAPEPEPVLEPMSERAREIQEKARARKIVGSPRDRSDRLALFVCDSYWLRAHWEITPALVERVRSAMGRHWYTADPVLRVFLVDRDGASATGRRELFSELEVRGGVDVWYIPVDNPPSCYMVELGYKARDGQFFTLISSNAVLTPQRYVHDSFGRSPLSSLSSQGRSDAPIASSAPSRARAGGFDSSFDAPFDASARDAFSPRLLELDVELVIKGRAVPGSVARIKDEPIRLASDGAFSVRYSLPERRHVFPVSISSRDGMETRTVVLAVDRNTKKLDPVYKDDEDD